MALDELLPLSKKKCLNRVDGEQREYDILLSVIKKHLFHSCQLLRFSLVVLSALLIRRLLKLNKVKMIFRNNDDKNYHRRY